MDLQKMKLVGQAKNIINELASDRWQAKDKGEFVIALRRIEAAARTAVESLVSKSE